MRTTSRAGPVGAVAEGMEEPVSESCGDPGDRREAMPSSPLGTSSDVPISHG